MIKTKASMAKDKELEKNFKVIKFDGLKKLPKTKPPNSSYKKKDQNSEDEAFDEIFGDGPSRKKSKSDKNEVTFDKARKEILNFGLSGKNSSEKSDQITQLLIKLGAKPPKKQSRNYKEILEEKKRQKEVDSSINKRTIFGTSASLQYRYQKNQNQPKKDDGLLKGYGKVNKETIKNMKQKNYSKKKRA